MMAGFVLLLSSCKKDDTSANSEYYYDASIGGEQFKEAIARNNTNSNLEAGSALLGFNDVTFAASIVNNGTNGTHLGIAKGVMHNYLDATDAQFRSFFTPGQYNYGLDPNDGFSIEWKDRNGTLWSSFEGTADQTGSTISILSITESPDAFGTLYLKTSIQFNCKLYDGNGNVKQATGTFVGLFGKI